LRISFISGTLSDVMALCKVAVGHVVGFVYSAWFTVCLWGCTYFFVNLVTHIWVSEPDGPAVISILGLPGHGVGCLGAWVFTFVASELLHLEVFGLMLPIAIWVWLDPLPSECYRFLTWGLLFPDPGFLPREVFVQVLRVSAFPAITGCHECWVQSVP